MRSICCFGTPRFFGMALMMIIFIFFTSCRAPEQRVPSEEARQTGVREEEGHIGDAPATAALSQPPAGQPSVIQPSVATDPRALSLEEQRLIELRERRLREGSAAELNAEAAYRLALNFYQQLEFERAEEYARQALQLNPNHVEARRLLDEIWYVLGKGRPGAVRGMLDHVVEQESVKVQQAEAEIKYRISVGRMHMERKEYDKAIREFEHALDMTRAFPYPVQFTVTYREEIEQLLSTAKAKWEEYKALLEKERQAKVEEMREKEEAERQKRLAERVSTLMRQAKNLFAREEFHKAELICKQILDLDPTNTEAATLRDAAATARRKKYEKHLIFTTSEEWKKTREYMDRLMIPQVENVVFPDAQTWDMISRRRPLGYEEAVEELSPEAKEILSRIQNIRISIDFHNTPLSHAIEFLRQTSGVSMVVDPDVPEEEILVTITVEGITIESALKLILETRGFSYKIEDGYITIGTREEIIETMVRRTYPIQDLTIRLPDYPAPEISLVPLEETAAGVEIGGEAEDPGRAMDEELLITLIRENIARGEWAEPGQPEPGKGTIEAQRGVLIVRHTPEVHEKIESLLAEIRGTTGMLVIMETRFLWVYDNFLREVGVDLRGLDGNVFLDDLGIYRDIIRGNIISDIEEGPNYTYGYWRTSRGGAVDVRGRLENIFDVALGHRVGRIMTSEGGANFEFTLLSRTQLNAIIRAVRKSHRATEVIAPRLTVFNTQRGNVLMANQFRYVSDYDVEVAAGAFAADPIPATVNDGITLDARPTVSADRKYITLELRPTVARLAPPPPNINSVLVGLVTVPHPVVEAVVLRRSIELPIIEMQRLRTTVIIPDGGTLIAGGFTTVLEEDLETGVPILSRIPIISFFFGRKGSSLVRRHLLIIVRAQILILEEEEQMRF